jgi:hypothetical protein
VSDSDSQDYSAFHDAGSENMADNWLAGMDDPAVQPAPELGVTDSWLAGMDDPMVLQPVPETGMTDVWLDGMSDGSPGGIAALPDPTDGLEGAFPGAGIPSITDLQTQNGSIPATTEAPYGYTATVVDGEMKYVDGGGRIYDPGDYLPRE